jgi:uncharacterized tellurite resistance protein B-like protein
MKIEENSSEAMLMLMLNAMHMDGKIRFKELDLYQTFAKKLGLKSHAIEDLVLLYDTDPVGYTKKAIEAVTDVKLRKAMLINMTSIALIDEEFHPYEKALLASLEKSWNI